MVNVCGVCKTEASQSCSSCNEIYYCTKEHQKVDWKRHKIDCAPFKIVHNDNLGRFLIATRDISQGEVIMRKAPLILGPKMVSTVLCLGCHKKLQQTPFYNCSKCCWPLCGEKCENTFWHQSECAIFVKSSFKPNVGDDITRKQTMYSCIVPLRVLLLKFEQDQSKYKVFSKYQSHLSQHKKTHIYQILETSLVPLFLDVFGFKGRTNSDEILEICSILDTNAFEVRDLTNKGSMNIRGFYPTMSLLSHDCRHNTKHCFDNEFRIILQSTLPIRKGDRITTTYTQTLWGSLARRTHLKVSKLFDCTCARCADSTEFGTYAGSILCQKDGGKIKAKEPFDYRSDWVCEKCGNFVQAEEIIRWNDAFKREIAQLNKSSPKDMEDFLTKYSQTLHPTNCHALEVKYALTQMYGHIPGYKIDELSNELLERKIELCLELLQVADVLESGYTRFRGCLLYDLQNAMATKARVDFTHGRIAEEIAQGTLEQCMRYFEEAAKILAEEPDMKDLFKQPPTINFNL